MSDPRICRLCKRVQAYAQPICRSCGGSSFDTCTLPMEAIVFSHTTVSRAPTPELAAKTPDTALLVRAPQGGLLLLPFECEGIPPIGATVSVDKASGALVALPA